MDLFQFLSAGLEPPAGDAFDVIPSDIADLESVTRGIYCGIGGDLHVLTKSGREITFKNFACEMTHLTDAAEASGSFNHSLSTSESYLIHVISVGTSLTVKLQYSTDDFSADTNDEPDTNAGNDTSIAITSAGLYQVNCPNPCAGYTRLHLTAVGAVDYAVISVSGLLYHKEPVPA